MRKHANMDQMVDLAFDQITQAGPDGVLITDLREAMIDEALCKREEMASFDHASMAVHYLRREIGNDLIVTDQKWRFGKKVGARYRLVLDLTDAESNRRKLLGRLERGVTMSIIQQQAERVRFTGYPGHDDEMSRKVEHLMVSVLIILGEAAKASVGSDYNPAVKRRRSVKTVSPIMERFSTDQSAA